MRCETTVASVSIARRRILGPEHHLRLKMHLWTLHVGDVVEVWSASRNAWFVGTVREIVQPGSIGDCSAKAAARGGAVKVKFGKILEKWVAPVDLDTVLRRHIPWEAPSDSEAPPSSVLRAVRRMFYQDRYPATADSAVTARELANIWMTATAEDEMGHSSVFEAEGLIRSKVERAFEELGVESSGRVDINDWVHYALLLYHPPGPDSQRRINLELRSMQPRALFRLVALWMRLDSEGTGLVCCADIAQALKEIWAPGPLAEAQAKTMLRDMDGDGYGYASYSEFACRFLNLKYSQVSLYWYDLSNDWARYLSPLLLGSWEGGIWHTGLCAYGQEYYFGGRVQWEEPGDTGFGIPVKELKLGVTLRTLHNFHSHIKSELERNFNGMAYDVFDHNCNHFVDEAARFLLGRGIPDEVRLQPQRVMNTPIARMLRPLLNHCLGRADDGYVAEPQDRVQRTPDVVAYDLGDRVANTVANKVANKISQEIYDKVTVTKMGVIDVDEEFKPPDEGKSQAVASERLSRGAHVKGGA